MTGDHPTLPSNSVPCEKAPLVAPNTTPDVASNVARVLTTIATVLAVVDRVLIVVTAVLIVIATVLVISTILTIVAVTTDGKVNRVIDRSTLGNWHENSLMVRSGGDGGHPVCTSRETFSDIGSELAIGSSSIETLEESKDTWVCGLRRVKGWDLFNDDVVVSDDLPGVVQLLRCGVVGVGSVSEGTGLHPSCVHNNGERSVRLHVTTVGRELKLDGWHVVNTRNIAHRRGVA